MRQQSQTKLRMNIGRRHFRHPVVGRIMTGVRFKLPTKSLHFQENPNTQTSDILVPILTILWDMIINANHNDPKHRQTQTGTDNKAMQKKNIALKNLQRIHPQQ